MQLKKSGKKKDNIEKNEMMPNGKITIKNTRPAVSYTY